MPAPATMRLCNNAICAALLSGAALIFASQPVLATTAVAQTAVPSAASSQQPRFPADTDPVRSPDGAAPIAPVPLPKEGSGYVLRTDVEEVVLNATVLNGSQLVENLTKDDFQVTEDGVKQTLLSFQHTDLPVSIGLVIDNSGSMYRKRPSVNKSALDLITASNPQDEAFVVNFSDEAFIDSEFTNDIHKLRDGLSP